MRSAQCDSVLESTPAGPPLLAMSKPPFLSHEHASALHSAVSMLPDCLVSALHALLQGAHELLLQPSWQARPGLQCPHSTCTCTRIELPLQPLLAGEARIATHTATVHA